MTHTFEASTASKVGRAVPHGKRPFEADLARRVLNRHMRRCAAGTMLVLEGEECRVAYIVRSGWLAISKTLEDGERQIVDFILPGDLVDIADEHRNACPVQVEALTLADIAVLPLREWKQLQTDDPAIADLNRKYSVAILGRFAHSMLRLGKGSAETRIAFALMELCVRLTAMGEVRNGRFHLPITQQHLGDFTGLSAVHVCRTLRRLARQAVLTCEDHTDIIIHDMDALAQLAGIDADQLEREVVPDAIGT